MEFQARRVLPIALNMRSVQHLLYTPAPDIVHEAAGHAPFIVDMDYAEFLQRFGEIGMRALSTQEDFGLYEAIRHLSIVKESAISTAADIAEAEAALQGKLAAKAEPSEAALLSRLHWWTVEYGLVGELDDYKLFGAGLLSSLGESRNCLDDSRVSKLPLTVNCVATDYDITREQPQLFVTASCKHLTQVLEEFARGMAVSQGGARSLRKARDSGTVATAVYSSGLQLSGRITQVLTDAVDNEIYIGTQGPTQLAYADKELDGHGRQCHADGFGSPVGQLKNMPRCLSTYTVDELKDLGVVRGQRVELAFVSGVTLAGQLNHIERRDHKNLLMRFSQCLVTGPAGEVLFQPEWGAYDMAVGERIVSVFGGTADREKFSLYTHVPSETTAGVSYSESDRRLFALYQSVRAMRQTKQGASAFLSEIYASLAQYPDEWLIRYELLEMMPANHPRRAAVVAELRGLSSRSDDYRRLIEAGLQSLGVPLS